MEKGIAKFFERKKRDLSNQSNDGDDSKKQKPSLADSSSVDDEVNNVVFDDPDLFEEGLNSPRCVGILYNCLKNLDTQVKAIHQLGLSNEENQIKGTKHLEAVTTSIDEIYKKFEDYEKERKEKDEEIKNLKADVMNLRIQINEQNHTLDKHEQYSRRNCLLLHGVAENNNESTDDVVMKTIREKMGEEIRDIDIDRTHRIGKAKSDGKSRPIIIKFARYNTRNKVFRKKKQLKGSGVSITESLTARRISQLKKAREEHEFKNVWSVDGRIMYLDKNDNKVKVYYD